MNQRKCYKKRASATVISVKLDLDTEGFVYHKWGAAQTCKPGDWLVNNQGDTYTVDAESFAKIYTEVSPGVYRKTNVVWAQVAEQAGEIETLEGVTHYDAGDYIVYNDAEGRDGYAVGRDKFESMYESC